MITGYRRIRSPGLVFAPLWRAAVATWVAAAFAWWVSKGFRM